MARLDELLQLACGGAAPPPSSLPTATQMSRPTVSASSIGPIGMPNASAASSTVSGAMPSSTARIAAIRYGASMRLTRKPGALFTGSGSLSIWRTNAAAARRASRASRAPTHDLDEHHARDRIEEVDADEARRVGERARRSPRAECSTCWSRGSRRASPSSRAPRTATRFASTFSKIASMITSARATPSPATSGISRSRRVAHAARVPQALGEELAGALRSRAPGARRSGPAA